MLTARRAFEGEDVADTLSAVMRVEPDWSALPASVPTAIRTLLQECLVKDRRERIGDAAAILFVLKRASSLSMESVPTPMRADTSRRAFVTLGVAGLASAVTGSAVWLFTRTGGPHPEERRFGDTPDARIQIDPVSRDLTLLADGSGLVYKGVAWNPQARGVFRLFLHRWENAEPTPLVEDGSPRAPFSSPDGSFVGFIDSVQPDLRTIPVSGGPALRLCPLDGQSRGASWGDDDHIVFATDDAATGLQRISARREGKPDVLTRPNRQLGEADHLWPHYLPGGIGVLFTITYGQAPSRLAVYDFRTRRHRLLEGAAGASQAQYMKTGHLVHLMGSSLRAAPFDVDRLEFSGGSIGLQFEVTTLGNGTAEFDISRSGDFAYVPGGATMRETTQLAWADLNGVKNIGIERSQVMLYPRLSPKESHVAIDVRDGDSDIWLFDLHNKTAALKMTEGTGVDRSPVWMGDGRLVAGTSGGGDVQGRPDPPGLLIVRREDPRNTQRIPLDGFAGHTISPSAVTSDGRIVFSALRVDQERSEVLLLDPRSSNVEPLTLPGRFNERCAVISPDERWLAYESDIDDGVTYRIFVRPFRGKGGEQPLSGAGGVQPLWSKSGNQRNGDKLFYATRQGEFWSVSVPREERWNPGAPDRLFPTSAILGPGNRDSQSPNYDVSKDDRFLIMVPGPVDPAARPAHILWTRNWAEFESRVRSD
jgi:serine/threonine-protein kinase